MTTTDTSPVDVDATDEDALWFITNEGREALWWGGWMAGLVTGASGAVLLAVIVFGMRGLSW